MMLPLFSVVLSKHYERLARLLNKRHPKFMAVQTSAIAILEQDPTNRSGSHDIKKLTNAARGEGQWRLAIGRFDSATISTITMWLCNIAACAARTLTDAFDVQITRA